MENDEFYKNKILKKCTQLTRTSYKKRLESSWPVASNVYVLIRAEIEHSFSKRFSISANMDFEILIREWNFGIWFNWVFFPLLDHIEL